MATKVYEFADCKEIVFVGNVEMKCYLREGHAGDHVGHYYWQSAQQSVQRTAGTLPQPTPDNQSTIERQRDTNSRRR